MDADVQECPCLGWLGMRLLHSEGVISHLKNTHLLPANSVFFDGLCLLRKQNELFLKVGASAIFCVCGLIL